MFLYRKVLILIINFSLLSCLGQKENFGCDLNYTDIIEEYDYENINKNWLKKDIIFFKELKNLCKVKPSKILTLVSVKHIKNIDLGNGYTLKKGSIGKGYLSLYYHFVYKKGSLIAYELDLPFEDILLLEKYGLNPQEVFKKDNEVRRKYDGYFFYYGIENIYIPINNYKIDSISNKIKFYMTPFSGIIYGCRGGYGNSILKNRCLFKEIIQEQNLTSKDLIYIMHSINLASRLTAIEYYTKNIDKFSKEEQNTIEVIIKNIFNEYGDKKINILLGDIGYFLTIEDAVNKNLETKCW